MKRAYTQIPEGQMHYRWAGSGPDAFVLLHMSGSSSDEFEAVGDQLAARGCRAYAVDLLGFGSSDAPPRYYSLADHGETIISFLDSLGLDRVYLYGNLAAANLCVHIAVDHPDRVCGMVLAHPLHSPNPEQYAQKRFLPEYSVIQPKADGSHMLELWRRSYKYGEAPEVCEARCRCLHTAGDWGETLHWALFEDTPVSQLFPRISVPTVVVGYESFGDPAQLEQLTPLIPRGTFEFCPGGTPYVSRARPGQVTELILKHFPLPLEPV